MSTSLNNSNEQIKVMNGFSTFSQVVDGKELWGVKNSQGEVVIPCKYEAIRYFNNEYISVKKNGLWGIVNDKDEILVPHIYELIAINCPVSNTYTQVVKNGLWRFINLQGEEVIPCQYEMAYYFDEEYSIALVCKNGLWGFIDKEGKEVIPCKYQDAFLEDDIWIGNIDDLKNEELKKEIIKLVSTMPS